jgi:arylsulfatase A-like enzyme
MKRASILTALGLATFVAATAEAATKPNIIVIVGDDMGYHDVGVHGCSDIPTPHIDSLAAGGVQCTSGYVSGPYCSPTRAGLLTGKYQTRFGHEFNPGPPGQGDNDAKGLDLKQQTLADRLKAVGYKTGMVGKWHLGNTPEFHPMSRGFDEFFGFLGGAYTYFPNRPGTRMDQVLRGRERSGEKEYLTDAFGREAVGFIGRHEKEPFFLYLTFNAVHTPMEATEKYLSRFANVADQKRRTYCAMMSAMDDAIGAVLGKLKSAGLEENTLIFFVSDNGGPQASNGSDNTPLRGDKATTWEGGVRVPYLVQWKGKLPAGVKYDQPVIQIDFLPTALAAAGAPVSPGEGLDGVNLLPYLSGESKAAPHKALYWRFGTQMAVRQGDWKLVRARTAAQGKGQQNSPVGLGLYNLAADIGEQKNLAAEQPEKVKELQAAWDEWDKSNVAASWIREEIRKPAAGGKKPGAAGKPGAKKKRAAAAK